MKEFNFSVPQDIIVGKGTLAKLPDAAKKKWVANMHLLFQVRIWRKWDW